MAERTFEALARFGREPVRWGFIQFVRMLAGGLAQETNLFPVSAAPFADEQVKAQAQSLWHGQWIVQGAVRTPINMEAWGTPEAYRQLMKLIPYKRIGEPDDIGRAAVWLASDESDYIHGASIFVDGGMTLYPGFETGGWAAMQEGTGQSGVLRRRGMESRLQPERAGEAAW